MLGLLLAVGAIEALAAPHRRGLPPPRLAPPNLPALQPVGGLAARGPASARGRSALPGRAGDLVQRHRRDDVGRDGPPPGRLLPRPLQPVQHAREARIHAREGDLALPARDVCIFRRGDPVCPHGRRVPVHLLGAGEDPPGSRSARDCASVARAPPPVWLALASLRVCSV